jgi:hypothetical protein
MVRRRSICKRFLTDREDQPLRNVGLPESHRSGRPPSGEPRAYPHTLHSRLKRGTASRDVQAMVMTSAQRLELMRLLERRPAIREHADPLWKLKKLQPVQLVELAATLGIDVSPLLGRPEQRPESRERRWYAERSILRGALQIVASSLLEQRTQEAAGTSEMYRGINEIEDLRAEQRARWAAQMEASRPSGRPKKVIRTPAKPPRLKAD